MKKINKSGNVIITNPNQWNHIRYFPVLTNETGFQIQQQGYGKTEEGQSQETFMRKVSEILTEIREEELDRWALYNEPLFYNQQEYDVPNGRNGYSPWVDLVDDEDNIIVTAVKDNGEQGITYDITLVGTPYLFSYSVKFNFFWRVGKFVRNKIVSITPETQNKDLAWDDDKKMWC
jgi:hypothetical protein